MSSRKPKKKKKKRDPLNLKHQTRPRREYIDYDYADTLNPEDREFLAKFTDEYYGGGGFKRKEEGGEYDYSQSIHKSDKLRRLCYNRNDSIKRCIYTLARTTQKLAGDLEMQHYLDNSVKDKDTEEILIDYIELDRLVEEKYKLGEIDDEEYLEYTEFRQDHSESDEGTE